MISLEESVGKLLLKNSLTLSVAESCTGGLIGNRITNISGSSNYFLGGVIAYDNSVKINLLKIKKSLLKTHGAVSEEVAKKMAENVRKIMNTEIGLSTTGIAGPSGGSIKKPVGLVWIGLSDKSTSFARKYYFTKKRIQNKKAFSDSALTVLMDYLQNLE